MIIEKDTQMMLFRYSNYKHHKFIEELANIIREEGYVWMLKLGRKSDPKKLEKIIDNGGWLVLRAPKSDGGVSYLAKFTEVRDSAPEDSKSPDYYDEIFSGKDNSMFFDESSQQWFRLEYLTELKDDGAASLTISKTGKKVDEVISTTRTVVMFIQNSIPIDVEVK